MSDSKEDKSNKLQEQIEEEKSSVPELYMEYKTNLLAIEKMVILKDLKGLENHYRYINKFRRSFTPEDFIFINEVFIKPTFSFKVFEANGAEIIDNSKFSPSLIDKIKANKEMFGFNFMILMTNLIDKKMIKEALDATNFILNYYKEKDSLTVKYLKAKAYYYLSLLSQKLGVEDTIVTELFNAYRQACIDQDKISVVTLTNCILKYYLSRNNVEQAKNFLSKTNYILNVNINEDARFLFYKGKIEAISLNYSEAYKHLSNSFRKAPEKTANGFKTLVNKFLILVQLLMGEIPDIKSLMKTNQISDYSIYKPYLELLKVVRQGNLDEFKKTVSAFAPQFKSDGTFNIVQRVREVVIKAGLRKINVSYSRILIKDITEKLKLENEQETEYILAKAIRDGVFIGTINHEEGYVQSKEMKDIYTTFEPQKSYQSRIEFLNTIWNEAKKGMKYSEEQEAAKKAVKETELEEDDDMDKSYHEFY